MKTDRETAQNLAEALERLLRCGSWHKASRLEEEARKQAREALTAAGR